MPKINELSGKRFEASAERWESVSRVRASGELDMAAVPVLRRALATAEAGATDIIAIDMSDVSFLDSTGLRALLEAHARAAEQGRTLVIAGVTQPVARVLDITQTRVVLDAKAEVYELLSRAEGGWQPVTLADEDELAGWT